MFERAELDDPGDDLAVAAVGALRSAAAVRACADAVELQAVATLVQVRRGQARTEVLRLAEVRRREGAGARAGAASSVGRLPRVRVDLEAVDRCTAQEVSVALWLSPVVARARMQLALELVEDRPATFDALKTGQIDLVRARRIVDALRTLSADTIDGATCAGADADAETAADPPSATQAAVRPDVAAAVEAEALYPGSVPLLADLRPGRPAAQLTPAQLTARLARLVLRAAPASAVARTEAADARRGCSLRVLPDGMALLSVTGRMELLGAAFARLDGTARALLRTVATGDAGRTAADATSTAAAAATTAGAIAGPAVAAATTATATAATAPTAPRDAGRTLDQARVDVFLATVLGHSHDLAQAPAVQVSLALVAPAATVLAGGDSPGELAGLGPVPAPLARALAADSAWVRWTADPMTGHVTDVGRRRYRPSAAVADLVRARDTRCRFPTCRRTATACDLDHVVPFPDGPTDPDNLATLCRTHHLTKHRTGFRLHLLPDGTTTWTTPTGQTITDRPASWGASTSTDTRPADPDPPGGLPESDPDPPPF